MKTHIKSVLWDAKLAILATTGKTTTDKEGIMENYVLRHKDGGYGEVRNGNIARTRNLQHATRLSYDKAANYLKNGISSNFRKCWEIVNEVDCVVITLPENGNTIGNGGFDWAEVAAKQQTLFKSLFTYRDQCQDDLQVVEREITDIQHYIEFFSLDAAKGYKAYKMLRDRLTRRRFLKDEIVKANYVLSGDASAFSTGKVDKQIRQMDVRQYSPRVLVELFGGDANLALTAAG